MREVDLATFAVGHSDGAMVIDVREPFEYLGGHVSDAELIPMGQLAARVADLPRGVPVYLICASGNRSLAAGYLTGAGVDAWSVAGGTDAWRRAGHPTVRGTHAIA
ncbi:rhodanese-like domain-containing protein [Plantactinospora sp. KLBMP9567]|uniref:rhodanese-like domain-containing protein n=1 Tax=Plantactinospora sp. KLBMP9567 TaxID=3085900 RepID=UPI00298147C4|nr:rhodanese-like domain-containing protein [Plantactinospora sp. KLBMP9567]MDW5330417.1 rhodanese-like domain-containing protein [Plantactinospora sp. KLBMP9567]